MAKIENDAEPLDDERVNLSWQVFGVQRSAPNVRQKREEAFGFLWVHPLRAVVVR